jgi:hypothetical protein
MQPRLAGQSADAALFVERNIGTEVGIHLEKDLPSSPTILRIRRMKMDFATFRNSYLDKIAEIINKGTPPTPFNTKLATTTGIEASLNFELFEGIVDWESALLTLNISDPRVFKFKPERKVTSDLWVRLGSISSNGHFFYEGEQTALIFAPGQRTTNTLPSRWDMDLSLQKAIRIKEVNGFFNLAVRNLRNSGRSELSGFFLQDRRWYASLGAQF